MRARDARIGGQFLARERGSEDHTDEIPEAPPVPGFPLIERLKDEQARAFILWCAERKLLREVA